MYVNDNVYTKTEIRCYLLVQQFIFPYF